MSNQPDHNHHVRRVVLPSGRSIEVVYFESPDSAQTDRRPTHADGELHVCPSCDGDRVYPQEWSEVNTTQWEVSLRCPDCEWRTVGVYDQEVVDRFDEELDRGTAVLVRDLKRVVRANMEDEVERFKQALDSDAIWPMDF